MLFLKNTIHASFFFLSFFSLFTPSFEDVDSRNTPPLPSPSPPHHPQITTSNSSTPPPSPPPPPLPVFTHAPSPFRPGIAVIVGVLTTMFSLTLLLLLCAKHCKRGNGVIFHGFTGDTPRGPAVSHGRKNSGIDRTIIESLPIFRFSSLRGQKDGLECAVCLNKFEPPVLLRLLPKCKHAFHVECVDTWLGAHSTCPLCRYRVDPEDILLIDNDSATASILHHNHSPTPEDPQLSDLESGRVYQTDTDTTESDTYRRISGRHSSAGENASVSLSQIVVQRVMTGSERVPSRTSINHGTASFGRRSLDSFWWRRKNESFCVGCLDRYPSHQRKDALLLTNGDGDSEQNRGSRKSGAGADKTRFEHRIIVSGSGFHSRWSDVQPSDLLCLQTEMILSESRPSIGRRERRGSGADGSNGRSVISSRSVSEITGLNRFRSSESNSHRHSREQQAGVVSRWLAWISSQSHLIVRTNRTPNGTLS